MAVFDLFKKNEKQNIDNNIDNEFEMEIKNIETINQPLHSVVVGIVQKGELLVGDTVQLIDSKGNALSSTVTKIEKIGSLAYIATVGETVGVHLDNHFNRISLFNKCKLVKRKANSINNTNDKSEENTNDNIITGQGDMNIFLHMFNPGNNLIKPDKELIEQFESLLPIEIINLWKNYGFGEYGDGIIRIINPKDYMEILYKWLGKIDYTRIPIIIDAFGDIFYYRSLENGANDISVIDVHYGEIKVCTYSYQEFFESFIIDNDLSDIYLRRSLYKESIDKFGKLSMNEIFWFVPAIKTLGYEHIDFIMKDKCINCENYLFDQYLNQANIYNKYKDMSSLMIISNVFPMENDVVPIVGNILKGTFNVNDNITIIRNDGNSFEGTIEKILIKKDKSEESVGEKDKVMFYLKGVERDDIKNESPIKRSALIKK